MQPQIFPERAALRRGTVAGRCWLTLLLTLWADLWGCSVGFCTKLPPVTVTGDPVGAQPRDSKGNIAPAPDFVPDIVSRTTGKPRRTLGWHLF